MLHRGYWNVTDPWCFSFVVQEYSVVLRNNVFIYHVSYGLVQ